MPTKASIVERVTSGAWRLLLRIRGTGASVSEEDHMSHAAFCRVLRAYYDSNSLYDGVGDGSLIPIRNRARRVVEFYPATIFPGKLPDALPIETDNEEIKDPIERIWKWSNWQAKKQVYIRWLALYGDAFIKVTGKTTSPQQTLQPGEGAPNPNVQPKARSVYMQLIDPRYVVDFEEDERGNVIWCRIDTPKVGKEPGGAERAYVLTEVWSKEKNSYELFQHTLGELTSVDQLGEAKETKSLTGDFGIDFVPIAHAKFQDIGEKWGQGAFAGSLDKFDEASRVASRGHELFFRYDRNSWALTGIGNDRDGRPLPAPNVQGVPTQGLNGPAVDAEGRRKGYRSHAEERMEQQALGKDTFTRLPGNSRLESLIPAIDYSAAQGFDDRMKKELEDDQPELAYDKIKDFGGEITGRAVRLLLSSPISRAEEVRGNAEAAVISAQKMALTIGKRIGLEGFTELGEYEDDDLEHSFAEREILPVSDDEREDANQKKALSLKSYRDVGLSEETAIEMLADHLDIDPEQEKTKAGKEREERQKMIGGGATPGQVGGARKVLEAAAAANGNPRGANGNTNRPRR